jgi:hypothetical protein
MRGNVPKRGLSYLAPKRLHGGIDDGNDDKIVDQPIMKVIIGLDFATCVINVTEGELTLKLYVGTSRTTYKSMPSSVASLRHQKDNGLAD